MKIIESVLEVERDAARIIRDAEEEARRIVDAARQNASTALLEARQDAIKRGESLLESEKGKAREARKRIVAEVDAAVAQDMQRAAAGRDAAVAVFMEKLTAVYR